MATYVFMCVRKRTDKAVTFSESYHLINSDSLLESTYHLFSIPGKCHIRLGSLMHLGRGAVVWSRQSTGTITGLTRTQAVSHSKDSNVAWTKVFSHRPILRSGSLEVWRYFSNSFLLNFTGLWEKHIKRNFSKQTYGLHEKKEKERGIHIVFVLFSFSLLKIVDHFLLVQQGNTDFYMTNPLLLNRVHRYTPVRQVRCECLATLIRWHISRTTAANTRNAYRKQTWQE